MNQPASYPANDSEEHKAIALFEYLLDPDHIKTEIKKRDKFPNIDGFIEIVRKDETREVPIGKLDVQIRKIPSNATSYNCPSDLVAYSEQVTLLPVLLICADPETGRVFWKHITREMAEYKAGQSTFTIKFDPAVDSVDKSNIYVRRWTAIVDEYQRRRSTYPHLKFEIEETLGLQSLKGPDVEFFQQLIDRINLLLDADFNVIKRLYFPNAWKLGVGVYTANEQEVSYQIYRVPRGKNAPLVASFAGRHFSEIWRVEKPNTAASPSPLIIQPVCEPVQAERHSRQFLKPPQEVADEFVLRYANAASKDRAFNIAGKCLTTECLFEFLDRHGHTTGLTPADEYSLKAVNFGIKVYLPVWYKLALQRWLDRYEGLVKQTGVFPSFEEIAGIWPQALRPTSTEVHDFIGTNREPFAIPIIPQFFQFKTVLESIDWLLEQNIDRITRLYQPRAVVGGWIWSGFTPDAARHNVRCILGNAFSEYSLFLARNGLNFKCSRYLDNQMSFVFAGEFENWSTIHGPVLDSVVVRNPDGILPKLSILDAAKAWEFGNGKALINGKEFEIVSAGGGIRGDLFGRSPMLTQVYGMLEQDLSSLGTTAK